MLLAAGSIWGEIERLSNLLQLQGAEVSSLLTIAALYLVYRMTRSAPWRSLTWSESRDEGQRSVERWERWRRFTGWAALFIVDVGALYLWLFTDLGSPNVLRNGGLVEGLRFWGSGYVEMLLTNGNAPREFSASLPFIMSGVDKRVSFKGTLDTSQHLKWRRGSVQLEYKGPELPQHYVSVSQIVPVRQFGYYRPRFWVKATTANRQQTSLFLALSNNWAKYQCRPPIGDYDWQRVDCDVFNVGSADIVEFRFVLHGPGTFWLGDAELFELRDR